MMALSRFPLIGALFKRKPPRPRAPQTPLETSVPSPYPKGMRVDYVPAGRPIEGNPHIGKRGVIVTDYAFVWRGVTYCNVCFDGYGRAIGMDVANIRPVEDLRPANRKPITKALIESAETTLAKTANLALRISPEVKAALEVAARADDRTVSYYVEAALRRHLEDRGYQVTPPTKGA